MGSSAFYQAIDHGLDEFFGVPVEHNMMPPNLIIGAKNIEPNPDLSELTPRFTEYAINFIKGHKKEPFFIYFSRISTCPVTSTKFKGKSKGGIYENIVKKLDWSVGEVPKTLQRYRLEENAFVIFTSDNGPWKFFKTEGGSSDPFREEKWTV